MLIKSNKILWDRCQAMKKGIIKKSQKVNKAFYGMCYCGVEEYVVPINSNGNIIGAILAGEFNSHPEITNYRIGKISKQYNIDLVTLKEKYDISSNKSTPSTESIKALLTIVADYISKIYESSNTSTSTSNPTNTKKISTEIYILSHAIEYIKQNFYTQVSVQNISNFCNCSESYLSHIFKKNKKITIMGYLNKIRIEQAKLFLINTDLSISEISEKIGFNDANYFSKVFHDLCRISARDYRKRGFI